MDFPTSVIKVTGNTELLTEILLGLPPKSLLRFQTVHKDWLFHISSQRFRLLHSRTKQMSSLKVDGLFFCWWVYKKKYVDFIPINGMSEKQKSMILKHATSSKIEHLHSCEAPAMEMINCTLFNYNPSTNLRRLIPLPCTITNPSHHEVMVMSLAFDPMVSDRYEIVCIMKSDGDYNQYYVYSSETRVWRNSTERTLKQQYFFLSQGVYLNGCMHWVSEISSFLRFDLDSMCFRDMSSTIIPIGVLKRNIRYFGESGGHLHLIVVDDKEKTTRFLVSTPEVIIEYDYRRTTIKEIMKIEKGKIPVTWEQFSVFEWYDAHQYIETMACV